MLSLVHRHLRHAGIALRIAAVAAPPPVTVPTINELLTESDVFGRLRPDQQKLLAAHFALLLRISMTAAAGGQVPEALYLLASGTPWRSRLGC